MKIMLDTNILLWALFSPSELSEEAVKYLDNPNNSFAYSVVSLWEVEIKHNKSPEKMPVNAKTLDEFCQCPECSFEQLPLNIDSISYLSDLKLPDNSPPHKDPFDKILICQAFTNNCLFLTHDRKLLDYNLPCVIYV